MFTILNMAFSLLLIVNMKILAILCQDENVNHGKFPSMYKMDDYYKCADSTKFFYCTANMNLIPVDEKSQFWKEIQEWSEPITHYNHTEIHRKLCIPKKYQRYSEQQNFVERKTNEELKEYNVSASMFSMDCMKEKYFLTDVHLVLLGLAMYFCFILCATFYDARKNVPNTNLDYNKYFRSFSIISNWNLLTSDKNADYKRLLCMQGIRTYQAVLVIVCHVTLAVGQLYVKNTDHIEKIYSMPQVLLVSRLFMFIVQTYFVMSSWLLTNQVLEMYRKNGRFSIRDACVLFLHRITRFWPPLLVMIFVGTILCSNFANGPGTFELANLMTRTCAKNWWATVLQLTNILRNSEVCVLGMWSLSLDTQYYVISLLLWYVTLNYRLDIKRCLACMFAVTYFVNALQFYQYDIPIFVWVNLKMIKKINFFHDRNLEIGYFGFWSNAGSSIVGILFGYFYFLCKEKTTIKKLEHLCSPTFALIPISALVISGLDTNRLVSAMLGPLLKPTFAFGIACGIYGMSRNIIQGWCKSICEYRYAVLLGNFTFSTYINHFIIVFLMEVSNSSTVEITELEVAITLLSKILLSFGVGIVSALTIEQPGINIKKIILPEIRKTKKKEDECNRTK